MTESEYILTSVAALLMIGLLRYQKQSGPGVGDLNLLILAAGSLVPLLDLVVGHLMAEDRIAFLATAPKFGGLYYGLGLIGAISLLAGCAAGRKWWPRVLGLMTAGYLLYQILLVLTPVGAPLLEPFSPIRWSFPVVPTGHYLLLMVLLPGWLTLTFYKRHRVIISRGVTSLALIYFLVGFGLSLNVYLNTSHLEKDGGVVHRYPGNPWFTQWSVIVETPDHYNFRQYNLLDRHTMPPLVVQRWNDLPLLINYLRDPVVRRFHYQVFRHPVVIIETSGNQLTLSMQEADALTPGIPDRTFLLESDLVGQNRLYQVSRFH